LLNTVTDTLSLQAPISCFRKGEQNDEPSY
jgi:hypothetical protein